MLARSAKNSDPLVKEYPVRQLHREPGTGADLDVSTSSPSLDSLVCDLQRDARADSLKYLLRSDTGHDGE